MKQKKVKRMVKATIKWEDGTESNIVVNDLNELSALLAERRYVRYDAHSISLNELRQGKDI